MDKTNVPPLPEPVRTCADQSYLGYTAEQMHEYAARAVREAVPGTRTFTGRVENSYGFMVVMLPNADWQEDDLVTVTLKSLAPRKPPTQDQENGS